MLQKGGQVLLKASGDPTDAVLQNTLLLQPQRDVAPLDATILPLDLPATHQSCSIAQKMIDSTLVAGSNIVLLNRLRLPLKEQPNGFTAQCAQHFSSPDDFDCANIQPILHFGSSIAARCLMAFAAGAKGVIFLALPELQGFEVVKKFVHDSLLAAPLTDLPNDFYASHQAVWMGLEHGHENGIQIQ